MARDGIIKDMDWGISGHEKQLRLLESALQKGKLAHAYVFAGPAGIGKKLIVKKLAEKLLESSKDFHPDLHEISGDEGTKIEQIRDLIYKLSLKPYSAKNKVALIDNAQEMTTEAANALLKALEEPKSYTYIFLITGNPLRLPKTILSSCQKITFGPVAERSDESYGSDDFFAIFKKKQLEDKLIAAYDMAELESTEVKKLLENWSLRLEDQLLKNPSKELAGRIAQVLSARKYLDQNVNVKLLLTNLMLNS